MFFFVNTHLASFREIYYLNIFTRSETFFETISNLKTDDLATEESIGTGFAERYYDALAGQPNASALRQFYDGRSKYVFAQTGRPDYEMEGLLLIGRFLKRMEYDKCTVTVWSVVTVRKAPDGIHGFVGLRTVTPRPRTFTQSSVIKRVPWTTAEFQIALTRFKFDDGTADFSIAIAVGGKPEESRVIRTEHCAGFQGESGWEGQSY